MNNKKSAMRTREVAIGGGPAGLLLSQFLRRFPERSAFDLRMPRAEIDYLESSIAAQTALAENYSGLSS